MTGQTIHITNRWTRKKAHELIDNAAYGYTVHIKAPTRSNVQNRLFHKLLDLVIAADPQGLGYDKDTWRTLFMQSCGHKIRWVPSLDGGEVVPVGMSTRKLTKTDFSDLIESVHAYAAKHGVKLED
jgi:hypothetical protein